MTTRLRDCDSLGIEDETWTRLRGSTKRSIIIVCLSKYVRGQRNAQAYSAQFFDLSAYRCPFVLEGEDHWHVGHTPSMESLQKIALAIRDLHGNHPGRKKRSAA
jgi:hypothetical protein